MPTSNIQFRGFFRTFSNFIIIPYYIRVNHDLSFYFILDVRTFFFFSLIFRYSSSNKLRFVLFIRRRNQSTTVYQFKEAWFMALTFNFLPFKIWQDSFFNRSIFSFFSLFFFPFLHPSQFLYFEKLHREKKERKKSFRLLCLSLSFYNIIPYFFPLSLSFFFSYSLRSRYSLINIGLTNIKEYRYR